MWAGLFFSPMQFFVRFLARASVQSKKPNQKVSGLNCCPSYEIVNMAVETKCSPLPLLFSFQKCAFQSPWKRQDSSSIA